MATPLRFKYKWPSEKKAAGTTAGAEVSDFIPYLSNVANMFARTPNPQAPTLIDPVVSSKISLANAKSEVENASRAADLSTQGLDAQTGAAIRVGNLATKLRSLSDLNSREATTNAQISNQANMMNANINAQNTGMINQYHDEVTNAQLTRNRLKSENLANAADKYIMQQGVKDQVQLEKDKANILSKQYNPGVYTRLLDKLQGTGTNTENLGTVPTQNTPIPSVFDKFKNQTFAPYTGGSAGPVSQLSIDQNSLTKIPGSIMGNLRKYLKQRNTYAAGGMMGVFAEDPKPRKNPIKDYGTTHTSIAGTNAFDNTPNFAMGTEDNRMATGIDLINSVVSTGLLPNQTNEDISIRNTIDPEMYQYLYQFNQRSDLKGMSPQQRVEAFYNIPSNNVNIQAMKTNMRRFGHGPVGFWRGTPSGNVTPLTKMVKRSYGGKMTKPFA